MTKHAPATPLPWNHEVPPKHEVKDFDGTPHEQCSPKDFHFARHACNAYPKLVAKVRELAPNDPFLAELGE